MRRWLLLLPLAALAGCGGTTVSVTEIEHNLHSATEEARREGYEQAKSPPSYHCGSGVKKIQTGTLPSVIECNDGTVYVISR